MNSEVHWQHALVWMRLNETQVKMKWEHVFYTVWWKVNSEVLLYDEKWILKQTGSTHTHTTHKQNRKRLELFSTGPWNSITHQVKFQRSHLNRMPSYCYILKWSGAHVHAHTHTHTHQLSLLNMSQNKQANGVCVCGCVHVCTYHLSM